jgi:hypothetical protein
LLPWISHEEEQWAATENNSIFLYMLREAEVERLNEQS